MLKLQNILLYAIITMSSAQTMLAMQAIKNLGNTLASYVVTQPNANQENFQLQTHASNSADQKTVADLDTILDQALKDYDSETTAQPASQENNIKKFLKKFEAEQRAKRDAEIKSQSSQGKDITPTVNFSTVFAGILLAAVIFYLDHYQILYTKSGTLTRQEYRDKMIAQCLGSQHL